MKPFAVAHAEGDDWKAAVGACIERLGARAAGANLGFVYVTDALAGDLAAIHNHLRRATGIEHWVGSAAFGVCAEASEYFARPAMAVMAATLPEDAFRVFPSLGGPADSLDAESRGWLARVSPGFGIVHADPANPAIQTLIEQTAAATSAFLVGGLTSSRTSDGHQVAGCITEGGLSGVLFAPEVEVATGLSQGCAPIAGSHLISECDDNVIIGLDGRRALDVFIEDIGEELAADLTRVAGLIHAAIPIEGSDTGDYLVRNLIAIDPENGWLAIAGAPEVGGRVMFVRRDRDSAADDLAAMVARLKGRLAGPPRGGVYFSCQARGPSLFGAEGREMETIRDGLGEVPLVGFFAGGEISNDRLYAYTGVLTLFT